MMSDVGKWHDKVALECGITGRKYTYDDIRNKSRNFSKYLRKKLKLQRQDVTALILPNIPEFPICVFGTFLAGFRLTTINPGYTTEEIKRQLVDSDAKVLVVIKETWTNAKTATIQMKKDLPIIVIKTQVTETIPQGAIDFKEFVDETLDFPDADLSNFDDVVFMPYSSGTTGISKGVKITNRNIVANILQGNGPDFRITEDATETHQDVTLAVLPFFHVYGFSSIQMNMFRAGGKIVTLPKFSKQLYLNSLIKHKPHLLMTVPPIVIFLNTHPDIRSNHLQSLRTVTCGAAPLGALDEEKLRQKVGKPLNVSQGYGLSEGSSVISLIPSERQGKYPGSMGYPLPNTILKVIDHTDSEGKHLGPNKTGELLIQGPQVMQGYHNKPEETTNSFLNGWLRTDDLVYHDENDMFYIADRIKDLIKVKGFQVAPAELEEIIRDFPGVADAAVIGIPDQYSGELPRAYVVAKENVALNANKVKEFVASKVARHKKLGGGVVIVDNIPKMRQVKLCVDMPGVPIRAANGYIHIEDRNTYSFGRKKYINQGDQEKFKEIILSTRVDHKGAHSIGSTMTPEEFFHGLNNKNSFY